MSVDRRKEERKNTKEREREREKDCILFHEFMEKLGLFFNFWVNVLTDYI